MKERGREREERNTSSCTAMAKTSTGEDKETSPIEKKMGINHKVTSGEKGEGINRPIKFSLKK